jgi:hypothetical protein
MKELKSYIKEGYGSRCKDHDIDCTVCKVYDALDVIERSLIW